MTWNPPTEFIDKACLSVQTEMPIPRAREVGIHRSHTRTQLPIHKSIYVLIKHIQSIGAFNGSLPYRDSRNTVVSEIWLPGRSRTMTDNQRLDAHQCGLAMDLMVSAKDPKSRVKACADYLLSNVEKFGIYRIIWDGMTFDGDRLGYGRWHVYTGKHKHEDHIHCEVTWGSYGLPFYRGHK